MLPERVWQVIFVSPPTSSHARLEKAPCGSRKLQVAVATCQEISTETQLHEAWRQRSVLQDGSIPTPL